MRIATQGIVGAVMIAVLWPQLALTQTMLTDPSRAELPTRDQWRYFEHRWSLYGLSKHVAFLTEAAQRGPIVVVRPIGADEWKYTLPYNALRYQLRGAPGIAFTDIAPNRNERSNRTERTNSEARRPRYLITNELSFDSTASSDDQSIAAESRLASGSVARRTVRPDGRYSLTLYRVDSRAHGDSAVPETT